MKKASRGFFALLLIAAMLLTFAPLVAFADDTPTFTIGTATANPGDTIEVPVSYTYNSFLGEAFIQILYDENELTLINILLDDKYSAGNFNIDVSDGTIFMQAANVSGEEFLVLVFEVNSTATIGSNINIGLHPIFGQGMGWFIGTYARDFSLDDCIIIPGSITVGGGGTGEPKEISGTIDSNAAWNDGDVVSAAVTIEGGADPANPVEITVNGTVTVKATITVTDNVKITGGGMLLRDVTFTANTSALLTVKGNLTLENITIDGNRSNTTTLCRLIEVDTGGKLIINSDTFIQNNEHTGLSGGDGNLGALSNGYAIRVRNNAELEMNGGEIKNNTSGFGGAVGLTGSNSKFTLTGGSFSGNKSTNTGHKDDLAVFISNMEAQFVIAPKADIFIEEGFDTPVALVSESIPVVVTPVPGYSIASVKINGELQSANSEGNYTFNFRDVDTGFEVVMGEPDPGTDPGGDPSIDTSWYNSTDTAFTLSTAAEFAGFAAIVNNKPDNSDAGALAAGAGIDPAIPADDFLGKTVVLDADIDLGGIMQSPGSLVGTTYTAPVWGGDEWTPIGSYTGSDAGLSNNGLKGRPFKGTFDGGFHEISNIYIPGNLAGGYNDAGDNSHALFGDLGLEGLVKNVIIKSGYIRGDRFTAGVVGRNWGNVESCANYATIETDGSRSGGGIAGVNYKNNTPIPVIRNCFNAGIIAMGDSATNRPGGIVGDNEGIVENSYNIGRGAHKTSGNNMAGIVGGSIGTVLNSYSLEGAGMPTAIAGTAIPDGCAILTETEMKAEAFVLLLNAGGGAFNFDSDNINGGFPVLAGQGGTPVTGGGAGDGVSPGGGSANSVDYAWSYGGAITEESGIFTITPYTATGITYKIDTIYVDGVALTSFDPEGPVIIYDATSSLFASFAYTINFLFPANGALSVSRGGVDLERGTIVRGGEILTITATPNSSSYELDTLNIVGLTQIGTSNQYTVTAVNGELTPSVTATFKSASSQTKLTAPVLNGTPANVTAASITLNAPVASTQDTSAVIEYRSKLTSSVSWDAVWQTSAAFTGLTASTSYDFQARYRAIDTVNWTDSDESNTVTISTEAPAHALLRDIGVQFGNADAQTYFTYDLYVNETSVVTGQTSSSSGVIHNEAAETGDAVKLILHVSDDSYGIYVQYVRMFEDEINFDYGGTSITPTPSFVNGEMAITMPANVSISIRILAYPFRSVTVAGGIENGTLSAAVTDVSPSGTRAIVTPYPDAGYRLSSMSYSTDGGDTWTDITSITDGVGTIYLNSDAVVTAVFVQAGDIIISTEDDLFDFAAAVNAGDGFDGVTVSLTNDITLTRDWTPIGEEYSAQFRGTFDGGGNTITINGFDGATGADRALFGFANTVRNLTVSGTIETESDVGSAAGIAYSATLIENCVNYANIRADISAGGIAILAGTINNCANYGSIAGRDAAGIVWSVNTLKNCVNYGAVASKSRSAGIVVQSMSTLNITGCVNKGVISVLDSGMASGIIVLTYAGSHTITNCYNTGDISGHTAGSYRTSEPTVAGILAAPQNSGVTITNCYNTGTLTKTGTFTSTETRYGEITPAYDVTGTNYTGINVEPVNPSFYAIANCYTKAEIFDMTTADAVTALGAAYKEDTKGINPGNSPLLTWESGEIDTSLYRADFIVTPSAAAATVELFTDADRQDKVTSSFDSLLTGMYYYTVSATGFATEYGSFMLYSNLTINVTLKELAVVTFVVTPAGADMTVSSSNSPQTPVSQDGGIYVYHLNDGEMYSYTATATGYNGTTREFRAEDGASINVTLAPADTSATGTVYGGDTISQGGVYNIGRNAGTSQGTITINTTEPVTLIGTGASLGDSYDNLYIDCAVDGVTLTLKDVYIYNTEGITNMINFRGAGNYLYFGGVSILDMDTGATGYAMIHVNAATSLTLGGLTDDDTLYLYKREQGSGIGGNGSGGLLQAEYNGDITILRGRMFMKSSKQGALIGSGAGVGGTTSGSPGNVTILGGELNLLPISRGAAIGGSAGSGGGARGADVYVYKDANINFNVDYSGAAIGGGGYDAGNDADGGVLHYYGGTIRTFIDYNAVAENLWPGVTAAGVNDTALTAAKRDAAMNPVYLFVFDTQQMQTAASNFAVYDGGTEIYSGGLHRWSFVNENLHKDSQLNINYTVDNWAPLDDPCLYLYLTGEEHELTVNGEAFTVVWDGASKTFSVMEGESYAIIADPAITGGSVSASKPSAAAGETITVTVNTDSGYSFVAGSLKYNGTVITADGLGIYSFTMPAANVTLTAQFALIPVDAEKYAVTVNTTGDGGAVAADNTEAAEGETIAVTVTLYPGWQLKSGSLKANGVEIVLAGGVYSFLMPAADVIVSAVFEEIEVDLPNGALFENGKAQDFVLEIDKDFGLYDSAKGVTVNGVKLQSGAYSVSEGSTVVTINREYLNTLTNGTYTVVVYFKDGAEVRRMVGIATGVQFSITVAPLSGGQVMADKYTASEGETITVTVTPDSGKRLVAGSLQWDGRALNADADGKYRFVMPAWNVTLTASFTDTVVPPITPPDQTGDGDAFASVWDGRTIDIKWFTDNPSASSYTLTYPAELAGLAALVNGLYNREIDTIRGDQSFLRVNTGLGDESGPQGNNKSTSTYYYGDYNFAGKTINLGADINMGSANYMPIGGQYLMTINDSSTRIDASFCGVFDGQGHSVTIRAERRCTTGNFGDGQSVGLIGRIGVHDDDPASLRPSGAAIRNVAVYGSVNANRSVGGIVGKIGKTAGDVVIENCVNFASVSNSDAKGCGGIVGAGWNGGLIRNCYNAGNVSSSYACPTGGISGSNEIQLENCYNIGMISAASSSYAMAIGTNNGGAPISAVVNCWYLEGSAPGGGYFTSNAANNSGARTAEYMKSDAFVNDLGSAFRKDTNSINGGYPVLAWQGGSAVKEEEKPPAGGAAGAPGMTQVESETTVEGGSATTVIGDIDVPQGASPTVYVVTVDTDGEDVGDVTAAIDIETLQKVADAGSSLRIDSPLGSLTLPNAALKTIADGNTGTLNVYIEKQEDGGAEFKFTADGKSVGTIASGIVASIPVPETQKVPMSSGTTAEAAVRGDLVAIIVATDGTERIIKKSYIDNDSARFILNGDAVVTVVSKVKSFADVRSSDWFYSAVSFAAARELFQGTTDTQFSPNAPMTRAMLATVLWRLEDEIRASGGMAFDDVRAGEYYTDAIAWASANGIVDGYGNGRFGTNDSITREQLATMLFRYAKYLGMDTSVGDVDLSTYADADKTSDYASDAMRWAVANGIITGTSDTTLTPQGTATRAQVATMLMRFVGLITQ